MDNKRGFGPLLKKTVIILVV